MHYFTVRRYAVPLASLLLGACAGSGDGLNSNGMPATPGSAPNAPLTATFQSIQDNVFTPICTHCHSGAAAPQGLQLDAGHSYALLVGVPSSEASGVQRVKPGDPGNSYLVQKLEGASGIVGARMPFGGPYLPQSTIDIIRQWITDGAQSGSPAQSAKLALAVTATSPVEAAVLERAPAQLLVAFNRELDFSLVNASTISVARLADDGSAQAVPIAAFLPVEGNPAAVLLQPAQPLAAGTYRLVVRGTGAAALADLTGEPLGSDIIVEFSVESAP
jgi:methionine-rich copper-binding protein CopC